VTTHCRHRLLQDRNSRDRASIYTLSRPCASGCEPAHCLHSRRKICASPKAEGWSTCLFRLPCTPNEVPLRCLPQAGAEPATREASPTPRCRSTAPACHAKFANGANRMILVGDVCGVKHRPHSSGRQRLLEYRHAVKPVGAISRITAVHPSRRARQAGYYKSLVNQHLLSWA
jgi:hypothetical protein